MGITMSHIQSSSIILLTINLFVLGYSLILNKIVFRSYFCLSTTFLFNILFFFFYTFIHCFVVFSDNLYRYYQNSLNINYSIHALILVTLCLLFFNIGSTLFYCRKIKYQMNFTKLKKFNPEKMFFVGFLLFVVGFVAKLINFAVLGHGNLIYYLTHYFVIQLNSASDGAGFEQYLLFLFSLIDIGVMLMLVSYIITKKYLKVVIVTIILSILISFTGRLTIIKMILEYMIIFGLYSYNFRKKIPIYFLFIFMPIIFFLVTGLGYFRDFTNNKVNFTNDYIYFFIGSNHGMRGLTDVIEHSSLFHKRYYGSSIILPILFKPIPRKIWQDKPLNTAAIYTNTMEPNAIKHGFAIAPGLCTDLYLNFGYLGTILSFMLLGYFLTLIFHILIKNFVNNIFQPFYPVLIASMNSILIFLRGEDLSLIIYKFSFPLIILCIIFVNIKIKNSEIWSENEEK